VFGGFLRYDASLLRAVESFDGGIEAGHDALTFTIPGLFAFARRSCHDSAGAGPGTERAQYLRFRKALYGNPANRAEDRGGRVEVATADDHDRSVHRLLRVAAPA